MVRQRGRSGSEPLEARSAIGLRRVLSVLALVIGLFTGVAFGIVAARSADPTGPFVAAAIGAVVAVIAAADLVVLRRR